MGGTCSPLRPSSGLGEDPHSPPLPSALVL